MKLHFKMQLHTVRDVMEKDTVLVKKIGTEDNATNMLTKSLPGNKFKYCSELVKLGPCEVD